MTQIPCRPPSGLTSGLFRTFRTKGLAQSQRPTRKERRRSIDTEMNEEQVKQFDEDWMLLWIQGCIHGA
jgi:hypothetical protein